MLAPLTGVVDVLSRLMSSFVEAFRFQTGRDGVLERGATGEPSSRACTKSRHEGKRFVGSLDSARARARRSCSGAWLRSGFMPVCCRASWRKFVPENGGAPVSNSQYETARLY